LCARFGEKFDNSLSVGFIGNLFVKIWHIELVPGILNMSNQFGSQVSKVHSSPKEIPGGSHFSRVDVGHGNHATSQKGSDLLRIDTVVFSFTPVDRFSA
jgi:hypothetical protein